MKRFLLVLAALAAASLASAQTTVAPGATIVETVSVSGIGRASVVPDRFTFTVGVQSVAGTVDDAIADNNRRTAAVIAALKKAGASERDIQTSQFNIWPQQDHSEGRLPRILGYQVTNSVSVRSSKVGEAGRLLGIAIGAGVNTSSGINFEVADPARGRDAGLRAAFEDAKAKATLLASAAGRTLGRALSVSEGGSGGPQPPMPMRAMTMEARVADVPVEAGTQESVYSVSVTFELR